MATLAADELSLSQNLLKSRWDALPRFDPAAAIEGAAYFYKTDFMRGKSTVYRDVRRIDAPNEGYLVWAGEWLAYYGHDGDISDLDAMYCDLRMW